MSTGLEKKVIDRYLWLYALLLVALTALAWGIYLGAGRPELKRPLFISSDRFRDLTNYVDKIAHLKDGGAALGRGLPVYNYPAPAAYVYAFLLRGFPHHPVGAYLSILGVGLLCGAVLLWKSAQDKPPISWGFVAAIIATGTFGFPMVFTADRGNLEGIVGLVLGTGLVLFIVRRYYGAAIFIGLAASIKPFPGLFLLLLLRKKLYREFATGVVACVCSTIVALTALGPTPIAAYKGLQPGVQRYYNSYIMTVLPLDESRFDHSIMDGLKSVANESVQALREHRRSHAQAKPQESVGDSSSVQSESTSNEVTHSPHPGRFKALFLVSLLLGAIGFVFMLFRFLKMPTVNQMILLSVAITLFPPVASEYTLLHLYVPFAAFLIFLMRDVATGKVEFERRHMLILLSLFALLFSPLMFFGRFAGDFQMLLLVGLLLAAGSYPMPSSIFNEVEPLPKANLAF